jgi:hypothetical protein
LEEIMEQGSNANGAAAILTDEQILGLEPEGATASVRHAAESAEHLASDENTLIEVQTETPTDSSGPQADTRNDGTGNAAAEPAWLKALDAHPEAAAEARQWRQAALDAAALDKDYFSAEPGARAALAARLHADDPVAFRSMLADAARLLAERDPQGLAELARQLGGASSAAPNGGAPKSVAQAARRHRGTSADGILSEATNLSDGRQEAETWRDSSGLNNGPQNDAVNAGAGATAFPADAYRAFEAAANDDVARQVRDSIDRTLAATLPDGIADGARRRIGEDIFRDLSATLSSDRQLSGQISELLRGWRFDAATRRQLTGLLAGRARTALPEVARRVVSEWTSSVLASDRIKQTRIESASSRRDITGGRLPEPVASGALRPRQFDYARTSDEQILEM